MISVKFYRRLRNWRWRIIAGNRKKIGASSEGYQNKGDAMANFEMITSRVIQVEGVAVLAGQVDWKVEGLL